MHSKNACGEYSLAGVAQADAYIFRTLKFLPPCAEWRAAVPVNHRYPCSGG